MRIAFSMGKYGDILPAMRAGHTERKELLHGNLESVAHP